MPHYFHDTDRRLERANASRFDRLESLIVQALARGQGPTV